MQKQEETLFYYNTGISFGLGAVHFSVTKKANGGFYFQHGTPQSPGKEISIGITPEMEKEIRNCLPDSFQNYEYIFRTVLKLS